MDTSRASSGPKRVKTQIRVARCLAGETVFQRGGHSLSISPVSS